ncbi:uncharacterized protein [Macrobrachium rosenbergii]|uniref:uncharacterized protein n=1 Tax=Macrobrachium rosenbergii TaxID=79674 RepID=UPI0034D66E99
MRLKLIATVILVGFYGDHYALPGISGSALNETNGTASSVGRDGSRNPRNLRDAGEYSSYLHHENNEVPSDNAADEISHEPYQDNHSQDEHQHYSTYDDHNTKVHLRDAGEYSSYLHHENNEVSPDDAAGDISHESYQDNHSQDERQHDPYSTYDDHNPKVHLLLQPEEKNVGHPLCPRIFRFSILGIILSMLLIFNGVVTGATLYNTVHSASSTSTVNTITNVNTNDNSDVNTNNNLNVNQDYNENQFIVGRQARQNETGYWDSVDLKFSTEEGKKTIRKRSCGCHKSRGEGSSLFPSEESLQGVWTVAQDFLSENHECASRMACEVASFFVPSSVSPLLTVLPSKMEGTRSLLMSAAAGNCAVAYDTCPISLDSGMTSLVDWL